MIRPFQPQDALSCCQLIHGCLENDSSLSPALRQKFRGMETPQSMMDRARLFYVAVFEEENRIEGIAGLDMNEIRLLGVMPDRQRGGIGRALLDHVKVMAPGALFPDIFVYSSIPSVGFYKACGFTEKGPFVFNLDRETLLTIFMTCPIGPEYQRNPSWRNIPNF
jgi:GNAT superfamily N-acetyltransferase